MMDDITSMTRKARQLGLKGEFEAAHRLLDEASAIAGTASHQARCAIERGRLHNSSGDPAAAKRFFLRAWDLARSSASHDLALDAAHMMAIVGMPEEAAEWVRAAEDYIEAHATGGHWRGPLYNNLGWTHFDARHYGEALTAFERALEIYRPLGGSHLRIAYYTIIRTYRALGRTNEAIELGESVIAEAEAQGEQAPYVCEELAECYAEVGDRERSRHYATRALAIIEQDGLTSSDRERITRLRALAG